MSETKGAAMSETAVERRLREMGAARNTARVLRRARTHVGCDEMRAGEDTACWQMRLNARCVSCDTTLVLSHALDEVLAIERRARRSVNVFAERLARCEGEK